MGVLKFDNVDDAVSFSSLDSTIANLGLGAWTCAALFRRVSDSGDTDAISYVSLSGSATEAGMSLELNDRASVDVAGGSTGSTSFTNTANPYLWAISKAGGSATPRIGWKLGSGGAWTHENLGSAIGNQGTGDALDIGTWIGGDPANMWIGLVGYWSGVLSDAQKQELGTNWQTSDWHNNSFGQPVFLCELNVTPANLVDLEANCVFNVSTGTTLDAGETLNSWNFNGVGTGAQVPPATKPDVRKHPKYLVAGRRTV